VKTNEDSRVRILTRLPQLRNFHHWHEYDRLAHGQYIQVFL